MINIVLVLLPIIACIIHLRKYGIQDRFDIDFLIVFVELLSILVYNIFSLI